MAKCINCGEELTDGAKFCMFCGARQDEPGPEAAVAAQADRVAELIENAPLAEEAAPAAEPAAEPIPAAPAAEKPAEPALTNEERSARLREQPSLEDLAAAAPAAPTVEAPVYTAAAPEQPEQPVRRYPYPAYEPGREQPVSTGSFEPRPLEPRPLPKEDPEKPGPKSKWQIMSGWGTFGAMLLMGIPVIGFILAIIWACGGCRKYAKRNLARAVLLGLVLCLVLTVAAGLVLRFAFPDVIVRVFEFFNPGYTIEF